jgi:hypothetical protein
MRKDSSGERWRRRTRGRRKRRRSSQGSNHALVQGFAAAISLAGPIYYVEK